ncbi:MAG TPA: hypothetical protein GX723_12380 [Thermoanaerobacterales bacterium]|nr:hypothetical protein [Thermoanaerobacterales bacterium]
MTFNTKNDEAWAHLFDKYKILDKISCEECFHITAGQINEFREARLMTKFDHRVNLPKIFYRNNLDSSRHSLVLISQLGLVCRESRNPFDLISVLAAGKGEAIMYFCTTRWAIVSGEA